MKLKIHFEHEDAKHNKTKLNTERIHVFPDNFKELTNEEQEKLLFSFIGPSMKDLKKSDIKDTKEESINILMDLEFEDREPLLGGCSISGATIHSCKVSIMDMAVGQLIRQVMVTLDEKPGE